MATKTTAKKAELGTSTAKATKVKEAPAKTAAAAPVEEAAKKETAAKEAAVKETTVKESAEKVEEKKAETKKADEKEAVKETAKIAKTAKAAKKTTTRRTTKKEASAEIYVQFLGREIYAKDVLENVKKIWTDEMGKKAGDLKDVKIYIKPEENKAYYVINGDVTGAVAL